MLIFYTSTTQLHTNAPTYNYRIYPLYQNSPTAVLFGDIGGFVGRDVTGLLVGEFVDGLGGAAVVFGGDGVGSVVKKQRGHNGLNMAYVFKN